ncbi:hypothetical protein NUK55_06815 [Aeromonas veronii]|nr:hypothetical protein [Aeromonas veronii]MCR3970813.1 hypothetical protein [Aeromonas veronii]MCR3975141.1 hypothetical protein [Aeromonas veronii]
MGSFKNNEYLKLNGPIGLEPIRDTLQRFVSKVEGGEPVGEHLLQIIAEGVTRHLEDKDLDPWPATKYDDKPPKYPSDKVQIRRADVWFYSKLLPDYRGKQPDKQDVLAKELGVSQPTINEDLRDTRIYGQSSAFVGRIRELLKKEGLLELTYFAGRFWTLEQMDDAIARLQNEGKE